MLEVSKLSNVIWVADITEGDVIAVTETWLDDSVTNSEILNESFVIHRRDRRNNVRGGGILLAVKK